MSTLAPTRPLAMLWVSLGLVVLIVCVFAPVRGFGFVEFEWDADCATAMSKMNGSMLDGRPLKVNEATPKEPR